MRALSRPVRARQRAGHFIRRRRNRRGRSSGSNWLWAELMRRSFAFDVLACPSCGGRFRLVALIERREVVQRVLRHLGLPADDRLSLGDETAAWRAAGIDLVVSLLEAEEEAQLVLEGEAAAASGVKFRAFPIPDRGVPASRESVAELADGIVDALDAGRTRRCTAVKASGAQA